MDRCAVIARYNVYLKTVYRALLAWGNDQVLKEPLCDSALAIQCPPVISAQYGASISGDINQRSAARFRLYSVVLLTKHTMLYYETAE